MPKLHHARKLAAAACWIAAALVPVLAVALVRSLETDLSPDDPLYTAAYDFAILAISVLAAAAMFVLVGAALLLSGMGAPARSVYLTALGLGSLLAWLGLGIFSTVFLLIAAGSFYLLWRSQRARWLRRAALGAASLSFTLALWSALPLPL